MKKNLATAMAAAMAFGAVVPAFAAEVETFALAPDGETGTTVTVDARAAQGYSIDTAAKLRYVVYNKGMNEESLADDTLRPEYKDAKVVYTKKGATIAEDKLVVATKMGESDKIAAKARYEAALAEIKEYKADSAYKVNETTENASFDGSTYEEAKKIVEVKQGSTVIREYVFTGVSDLQDDTASVVVLQEIFTSLNKKLTSDFENGTGALAGVLVNELDMAVEADYNDVNYVKYTLEKNASKFDFAKTESDDNNDLIVTVKKKGSSSVVAQITFENFRQVKDKLIVNVPVTGDFTGHWAADKIVDAMILGQVDASKTFRAEDGITRAEFAKMLCTIMGGVNKIESDAVVAGDKYVDTTTYKETFHDVENGKWYQNYIGFLQQKGIVQGDGQNFRPNDKITRQEVAVMVSNALNGENLDDTLENMIDTNKDGIGDAHRSISKVQLKELVDAKLADANTIAAWADHSVYSLVNKASVNTGVITGDGKNFNPTKDITRAEALVMAQRANAKLK